MKKGNITLSTVIRLLLGLIVIGLAVWFLFRAVTGYTQGTGCEQSGLGTCMTESACKQASATYINTKSCEEPSLVCCANEDETQEEIDARADYPRGVIGITMAGQEPNTPNVYSRSNPDFTVNVNEEFTLDLQIEGENTNMCMYTFLYNKDNKPAGDRIIKRELFNCSEGTQATYTFNRENHANWEPVEFDIVILPEYIKKDGSNLAGNVDYSKVISEKYHISIDAKCDQFQCSEFNNKPGYCNNNACSNEANTKCTYNTNNNECEQILVLRP